MDMSNLPNDPSITRFWEYYGNILKLFRVPAKLHPWYHKHVEAFIGQYPAIRLQYQTDEKLSTLVRYIVS